MCASKYDAFSHPAEAVYHLVTRKLTDAELAQEMGVSLSTLKAWKRAHPEFAAAVRLGKQPANEMMESAVFRQGFGYNVPVVETTRERVTDTKTGKSQLVVVKQVEKTQHVQGNPTSAIFWLLNRSPERWRDRKQIECKLNVVTHEEALEQLK